MLKTGHTLVDLGCGLGQDIRKLVLDGAPAENIYGSDIREGFIQQGYELFRDQTTLHTKFLIGDFFGSPALDEIDKKVDIIYGGSFFHLFDWGGQMKAFRRAVELLKPRKGSLIVGEQVGHTRPGEFPHVTEAGATMFYHDKSSFEKMWKQIGEETGTVWKVDVLLIDALRDAGEELDGTSSLVNQEVRQLKFVVERLGGIL
jgi:SAM-dependent methyltransferase